MILGLDLSNSIYHGYKKVNNCSYCMLRNLNEVHIFIEKKSKYHFICHYICETMHSGIPINTCVCKIFRKTNVNHLNHSHTVNVI